MTRGGKKEQRSEPDRRCIATGETQPKAGLIRFVASPEGVVTPDLAEKLPGRGIWVSADRAALELAVEKKLFSRSAKTQLTMPGGLVDLVENLLLKRLQDTLALARKSGRAVCGYEKVRGWLETEPVKVLLQASDGSSRGKTKVNTPEGARYVGCLTANELGLAFGRDVVIHAAVSAGPLATRSVEEAARLGGLRNSGGNGSTRKERKNA